MAQVRDVWPYVTSRDLMELLHPWKTVVSVFILVSFVFSEVYVHFIHGHRKTALEIYSVLMIKR